MTRRLGAGGTLWAEHVGGLAAPREQPPARCERCGCWLSRYRQEEEARCWACRHGGQELAPEERVRRLERFLAGRLEPVEPDPVYRCPECGGIKSAGAVRCAHCRYTAVHPRKPTSRATLKSGPCPVCGGRKNPKSRLCRACRYADQRLLFAGNPAVTCPDCGGPKTRKAVCCRKCRNRREHGTVYLGDRLAHLVCPDCGGSKTRKEALRCRICARKARSRAAPSREAPAISGD